MWKSLNNCKFAKSINQNHGFLRSNKKHELELRNHSIYWFHLWTIKSDVKNIRPISVNSSEAIMFLLTKDIYTIYHVFLFGNVKTNVEMMRVCKSLPERTKTHNIVTLQYLHQPMSLSYSIFIHKYHKISTFHIITRKSFFILVPPVKAGEFLVFPFHIRPILCMSDISF